LTIVQSTNIAHYSHYLTCFNHFLACVKSAASEAERRDLVNYEQEETHELIKARQN